MHIAVALYVQHEVGHHHFHPHPHPNTISISISIPILISQKRMRCCDENTALILCMFDDFLCNNIGLLDTLNRKTANCVRVMVIEKGKGDGQTFIANNSFVSICSVRNTYVEH